MTRLVILLALALAGCQTPAPELVPPPPDPCPASASAAVEPRPKAPVLTPEQQDALDVAVIVTLGPDLGVALIRYYDAEMAAHLNRVTQRVEQTRAWCEGRAREPDS